MLKGAALQGAVTVANSGGLFDGSGTPGNVTLGGPCMRFAIAAAASAVTVTLAGMSANSQVFCQVLSNDTTLKSVSVVPGSGSFVVTGNVAATANCTIMAMVFI